MRNRRGLNTRCWRRKYGESLALCFKNNGLFDSHQRERSSKLQTRISPILTPAAISLFAAAKCVWKHGSKSGCCHVCAANIGRFSVANHNQARDSVTQLQHTQRASLVIPSIWPTSSVACPLCGSNLTKKKKKWNTRADDAFAAEYTTAEQPADHA